MSTPVEQIKQRLSIVDVVGSYVALTQAGKHYKAKSPFTNERTPSFFVSPERGMYYCFSTGKGGDMFTFIEEMEGVDFKGALRILAERAGVALTPVDPKAKDEQERLFALLEESTKYYEAELSRAPEVVQYLFSRGVKKETVSLWRLGMAPDAWRSLKEHLLKKGFTEDEIFKAGLLKKTEGGGNSYDTFRNRVMFPIADTAGRVVGFSGRTLSSDPASPKYVNSPETDLFVKSHVLFGFYAAKNGIRNLGFSLVVEGQFDLVLSHQAGYTNTVALSGTALSLAHVELLQRLSNNVVLALDADTAGITSVKRSATVMLKRGMDVKVARIVGGKDPADLVREDPKLLRQAVGSAMHVIEFLLLVLKEVCKDERSYRLRVREEVLPFITLMPNRIDQEHFEQVVARELGVSHDAIMHEVVRIKDEASTQPTHAPLGGDAKARARTEEKSVEPAQLPKRVDDLILHLFGILLSEESSTSPRISVERLREGLALVLGSDSMQALLDWPLERKNEAIFKAETVYTDASDLWGAASLMLYELYLTELKRKLGSAREKLKDVERSGDSVRMEAALQTCNDISLKLKEVTHHNPFT